MKTNVLVKFAVVATAAFGAYAFSGNSYQQAPFKEVYFLNDSLVCTNILARCSNDGDFDCQIEYQGLTMDVFDLGCSLHIKHGDPNNIVEWKPISP